MRCPLCGHEIVEGQKFCPECAHPLTGITDTTQPIARVPVADDPADAPPAEEPAAATDAAPVPAVDEAAPPDEQAAALPALGDLPTQEIKIRPEIPDPMWATPTGDVPAVDDDGPELFDDLTTPTPANPMAAVEPEAFATTQIAVADTPAAGLAGAGLAGGVGAGDTTTMEVQPGRTDEVPLFDGSDDIHDFPPPREPFRLKVVFLLAFFGAVAVLMSAAADVVDIRTSTPVDGIATGVRTMDTLGTNLAVAGFFGASVMALGALLACFGFRWGAGLAGGAGLALAGWACLVVGLVELRVASAESITRQTTDIVFTLKVTRDVGFWLVVAVAGIGLLVFLASLRSIGTGGQPALNPWIAALGAVAGVVLVAGPLLPEGNARFANNYRSVGLIDIPTLYFGGRLAQLGLIALTVVFGLLIVRAYGLGLAAGGVSVAAWLWVTSLAQMGSFPLGIAAGNFGAGDSEPHAVTSVGMALTLLMLVVAAVLAVVGAVRRRPRY